MTFFTHYNFCPVLRAERVNKRFESFIWRILVFQNAKSDGMSLKLPDLVIRQKCGCVR
jgi:hypothetical protein